MSKVEYQKLRSLADVQAERIRIDSEFNAVKDRLEEDQQKITRMFSLSHLVEQLTGKAAYLLNIAQWAIAGYNFVRSMVDKFRTMAAERSATKAETGS